MASPLTTPSTSTGIQPVPTKGSPKRIICCCDGTWMDSLGKKGYEPPSNVTRISRVFCRTCSDGTSQIINYHAGVGTANSIDQFTGGAFGMGLDRDIREVYNFICTNYVDGDDIILIGFSRGAFTARSTADMIASIGLLTPEGFDHFYTIFDDYENIGNTGRDTDDFLVPGLPEYNNSYGQAKIEWENARVLKYKDGLKHLKYTRDTHHDGVTEIRIKALAVWDTVGTLGIPPAPVIGVPDTTCTWRFTNTQISNKVENAFQALALDEPRYAFRPALWERIPGNKTNLKQVWFPGTHSNVGGGWPDQQMANITLAWMCDQLSTLGVEFSLARMTTIFLSSLCYSAAHPFPYVPPTKTQTLSSPLKSLGKLLPFKKNPLSGSGPKPWAVPELFQYPSTSPQRDAAECDGKDRHPPTPRAATEANTIEIQRLWQYARPWGTGIIRGPTSILQTAAGKTVRRPGLFMRVDENTNEDTKEPLINTCERIHSSVRVRLVAGGLGIDDREEWKCEALLRGGGQDGKQPLWRLEKGTGFQTGEGEGWGGGWHPRAVGLPGGEYDGVDLYELGEGDNAWRWVYVGKVEGAGREKVPSRVVLPEEPLRGYWERYLLGMLRGNPDVWRWAQKGLKIEG
ncbi:hypothetical protein B0T17DRAFT_501294 [Bombardia bombarda]|uniref:T6SS Phospholipase effector Tle1-like catalytic domain-containing protein n=1 Tax=Bombardia bombarda TaxID=252184 RepID=A0AA39TJR5_9PEZI|nr:hypothetical protein B0T17DRAFT_501294 [Bombardia bombarda]